MSYLSVEYYPLSTGFSNPTPYAGESEEARKLFLQVNELYIKIKPYEFSKTFRDLAELNQVASEDNWDNMGSKLLDHDTYQVAKRFLLSWPSTLPLPELTVDRDGEVEFYWFGKNGRIFSASLRKDGQITFAYQITKRNKLSGVDDFDDSIPKTVIDGVKKIYSE